MTDSIHDRIELCHNHKLLIRKLLHEDKAYAMVVLEMATDNRISIMPFATETANTVFIDATMRLITLNVDRPYLIRSTSN